MEKDIDDILIWGTTEAKHNERLEQVLKKCAELNLTLNKEKCTFQVESVNYLENVIIASGVKPDPQKVRAVMNMPPPADRKDVERLLPNLYHIYLQ